jgi:hypothetical protein
MKTVIGILLILMAAGFCAEKLPQRTLYVTKYSESDRLERKIADCKDMPSEQLAFIHQWLEDGAWKKSTVAMPKLRSPGSFVFRRQGTDQCWIVSLLENVRHLTVKAGIYDAEEVPKVDMNSFACVVDEKIARMLEKEIEKHHPEGRKMIEEFRELAGSPSGKRER